MTHQQQANGSQKDHHPPSESKHDRKQRVLTKRTPSVVRGIADAIVIKDEDLFLLTKPDGSVPLDGPHGHGLYFHDCRFLNGYELKLADTKPDVLAATALTGYASIFQLTNPDIHMADGTLIEKEHIGIKLERTIDSGKQSLYDLITVENFERESVEFALALTFRAGFEDIFAIRGLLPKQVGKQRDPVWKADILSFIYDGADGLYRSLTVAFSRPPESTDGTTAHFRIRLESEAHTQIVVSFTIAESKQIGDVQPQQHEHPDIDGLQHLLHASGNHWLDYQTEVRSDNPALSAVLNRSLRDLRTLRGTLEDQEFFSAGVPWFATLFGRDSLISALQVLAYKPDIAAQTLRLLARYQGQRVDAWRDEQPGKILHERRVGELARLDEVPQGRYYGTIDATLLFLILFERHAMWTGDLGLFKELRNNVEQALDWMTKYGDPCSWGYIAYESTSGKGLINQGWKDSGDAIVDDDGNLAKPPIALVEVQGYAYMAKRGIADLYQRSGEMERAQQLRQEADDLRERFNHDFWLAHKGIYALALQADKRPAAVVSSNPGQALWTGIADPDKAHSTMERLMADDIFNGWGIRTLSSKERRYNPMSYHLGTVWPHDNSIIAAGFRRYGYDDAFRRILNSIIAAATHFSHYRLPELFSGFARQEYGVPVHYPVACHPQAWAAGAVPYLIEQALGLVPEAFDRRLRIVRPILPDWTDWIELRRLKVGSASTNLRFERIADGVTARVLDVQGDLEVSCP